MRGYQQGLTGAKQSTVSFWNLDLHAVVEVSDTEGVAALPPLGRDATDSGELMQGTD